MTAHIVFALALLFAALGCALLGVLTFAGLSRKQRGVRTLDHALDQRAASTAARAMAAGHERRPATDTKDAKDAGEGGGDGSKAAACHAWPMRSAVWR
jgi:tight adherence protein C